MSQTFDHFSYTRIEDDQEIPAGCDGMIDVALLDMNHLWPNVGHDAIVLLVRRLADSMRDLLDKRSLVVRLLSFDVRRGARLPDPPNGRFSLYLGTGGPGHFDPRANDGRSVASQGITEDPSWEPRLFKLFDDIAATDRASLFAVCHTFGILCRWSGVARAVLRGEEKGGKSSGVVDNVLGPAGQTHPWFSRFSAELADRRHHKILDNRLFDLLPEMTKFTGGITPVAWDSELDADNRAITMIEFARDQEGEMPRMFAVNHHPEIIDLPHTMHVLDLKLARGEVTQEWYDERARVFEAHYGTDEDLMNKLRLTSYYTFVAPIEYQLRKLITER